MTFEGVASVDPGFMNVSRKVPDIYFDKVVSGNSMSKNSWSQTLRLEASVLHP